MAAAQPAMQGDFEGDGWGSLIDVPWVSEEDTACEFDTLDVFLPAKIDEPKKEDTKPDPVRVPFLIYCLSFDTLHYLSC